MAREKKLKDSGRPSTLSAEIVVDSDTDEQSSKTPSSGNGAKSFPSLQRGKKRKRAAEPELDENSTQNESSESSPGENIGGHSESGDEDRESSQSDNSEDGPVEAGSDEQIPETSAQKERTQVWTPVPAKPYVPPAGFVNAKLDQGSGRELEELLSQDFQGKEIWHITAHASLPVKSIQAFSLDALISGKPILGSHGREFKFKKEKSEASTPKRLLFAKRSKNEFYASCTPISRNFHLQAVDEVPEAISNGAQEPETDGLAAESPIAPSKAGRPQPKGLRLRYAPFGVQNRVLGSIGVSSSDESDYEREGFKVPPSLLSPPAEVLKKKKKGKHDADHQKSKEPKDKEKKKKKTRKEVVDVDGN